MATKKKATQKKASIELDSRSAFAIHGLLQDGLIASNVLNPIVANNEFAISSKKSKIKIDAKTAQQISNVIKKGLMSSSGLNPKK